MSRDDYVLNVQLNTCKILVIVIPELDRKVRQSMNVTINAKVCSQHQLIRPKTPNVKTEASYQRELEVTPDSMGTPVSSKCTDNTIDSSPGTSDYFCCHCNTFIAQRTEVGHSKIVTKPDYSDFPVGGTYDEQDRMVQS